MRWMVAAFLCLAVTSTGCAAGPRSAAMNRWITQQGGELVQDARQQRLDRIAKQLSDATLNGPLTVTILDSDRITAYSWPNGEIFVTAGLLDACTDQQVAAAIAHEVGHLLNDGHLKTRQGVQGLGGNAPHAHDHNNSNNDIEIEADAMGCRLLSAAQLDPQAMASLLQTVREQSPVAKVKAAMSRRIAAISAAYGQAD